MAPILRIRVKTLNRHIFPFTERKNRPNWWKYPKFKKIIFAIFGQKSPKWILRAKIQKALKWPKTFYNPFWDQKTLKATCFDPQNMFLHPRDQYFVFWKKSFFGFFGWFCKIPKSSNFAKLSKKPKKWFFQKSKYWCLGCRNMFCGSKQVALSVFWPQKGL